MYSLRKSRKILEWGYGWYKKKGDTLSENDYKAFEADLAALDAAYLKGDQKEADRLAKRVEVFTKAHFRKTPLQYLSEVFLALAFALAIAAVVRQSWFEPYEIPTGSMRPTFKEQDRLTVSKTQFGINVPLSTSHFIFEPDQVKRNGIVIWSGDNIPMDDVDTLYFGVIPYKKRFVKRLIGKPGDILYFYGGQVWGIDEKGNLIEELLNAKGLEKIEHIPFRNFEGVPNSPSRGVVQFEQMHQPIARIRTGKGGEMIGEIYNGEEWVKDQPASAKTPHNIPKTYGDLWGISNYGMARLLTPEEVKFYPDLDTKGLEEGVLYLEIVHHPNLTYPKPLQPRGGSIVHTLLNPLHTLIPVQEKHLKEIMDNMYTARFEVNEGIARSYSAKGSPPNYTNPLFTGVPDGTYEFYYGKADKVGFMGWTSSLPSSHPLYRSDPGQAQLLYNQGIDFNTFYQPTPHNNLLFPHRYVYFRDGDLYLLGAPVYKKDDPVLQSFVAREEQKEKQSSENRPYIAFKDRGPPLKDGKIDLPFMRAYGLPLSDKQYLVLGDNHAMSADSRIFGFLPEENLQGVPSEILWPPGHRIGPPNQPPYPLFTKPRLIVWAIAALVGLLWYLWDRWKKSRPVFHKL